MTGCEAWIVDSARTFECAADRPHPGSDHFAALSDAEWCKWREPEFYVQPLPSDDPRMVEWRTRYDPTFVRTA